MRNITITTYASWITLLIAICAWVAVSFFVWFIMEAKTTRISIEATAQEAGDQQEAAIRAHAIARDTAEDRAVLESLANSDVISIVESIEAAGDAARVSVGIGQALADTPSSGTEAAAPATRSVNVVVEAQGSFGALMHAVALFYSLPIPSEITQIQIERLPDEAGGKSSGWRLVARIRVLTTAEISS